MALDPQALYVQLGTLAAEIPNFSSMDRLSPETLKWLGRVQALVDASNNTMDRAELALTMQLLVPGGPIEIDRNGRQLRFILYRALVRAELNAPSGARGAFVPAGDAYDGLVAIGKVFEAAERSLLVVDPYLDHKVVEFAGMAREGVVIRLLADEANLKPTLKPAVAAWIAQHKERPIEARMTAPKSLHDRLIVIDGTSAFTLTQSIKDFAVRSPASLLRVEPDIASLKIPAFEAYWTSASPLS